MNSTFLIAEISGNHQQDINRAKKIILAAKEAGANAVKLQTYTADTITLDCDNEYFQIKNNTIWDGRTFYDLYQEAFTPWEWHKELIEYAREIGIICFSTPFDLSAVDFLEKFDLPYYKIASFEINDIQLIEYIASKGKPIIMSTGVATLEEIEEAIAACRRNNNNDITLLKCTSAYPTPYDQVNLRTITDMAERFNVKVGVSDHTLGSAVAVAAVALGATVVEKHLTLDRAEGGVDASFSMEPHEFKQMVQDIRIVEQALGKATYKLTQKQLDSCKFKRSLFVTNDMKAGEPFTTENIRSVRPSDGLNTRYYNEIIGKVAKSDIAKGTPLSWSLIND